MQGYKWIQYTCTTCRWPGQTTAASQRQHHNNATINAVFLWCFKFRFLHLFTTPKLQTRRNWVSCYHLNAAWCTCSTFAWSSVSSTLLAHWQCAVWRVASWRTITTLDHSAEVLRMEIAEIANAKVGTRVLVAVGPFQWIKAFGWKIGMRTLLVALGVLSQQH